MLDAAIYGRMGELLDSVRSGGSAVANEIAALRETIYNMDPAMREARAVDARMARIETKQRQIVEWMAEAEALRLPPEPQTVPEGT